MVGLLVKDGAGEEVFVQKIAATLPAIVPLLDRKTLEFAQSEFEHST